MKNKASFVNFSIGNACNLRCNFCYNDSSREKKQYFEDIEVLKKNLLSYKFIGEKIINLIGGEPLLYPKIFELLDFLKENNFKITIITNGIQLAGEDFIMKLLRYKDIINYITISIHSHNSLLEDEITYRKGTFDRKIKGIKAIEKHGFRFSFVMVINNKNINYLSEILGFYKKRFNQNIHFQGIISDNNMSKKNLKQIPSYEKIIRSLNLVENELYGSLINWIPLCIHFKVKKINYGIRELKREYLFSSNDNGKNLLESHFKGNFIGSKCKNCFALGKFCFGPSKKYVEKFGYDVFKKLSKNNVINLIKKCIKVKENGP